MKLFMVCRSQINMCSSRAELLKDLLQDLSFSLSLSEEEEEGRGESEHFRAVA